MRPVPVSAQEAEIHYQALLGHLQWDNWQDEEKQALDGDDSAKAQFKEKLMMRKITAISHTETALKSLNNFYSKKLIETINTDKAMQYLHMETGTLGLFWKFGHTNTVKMLMGLIKTRLGDNYQADTHVLGAGEELTEREIERIEQESNIDDAMALQRGRLPNLGVKVGLNAGKQGEFLKKKLERKSLKI